MPTEPERDIEKTLRAYAQKRREDAGAPGELHPATRRLLQGEVARLRKSRVGAQLSIWARIFGGTWPQATLNVCVLLVVIAALAALVLPSLTSEKARSDRMMAEVRVKDMVKRDKVLALGMKPALKETPAASRNAEAELKTKSAAKQIDIPTASAPAIGSNLGLNESAARRVQNSIGGAPLVADRSTALSDRKKDSLPAATQQAKEQSASVAPTSPALASTFGGTSNFKKMEREDFPQKLAKAAPVVPPPATAAAPAPALAVADQEFSYRITNGVPSPPPPAVSFDNSLVLAGNAASSYAESSNLDFGAIAQKYARAGQPTNLSRRMRSINKVVLQSFRVEQTGNKLRIIDNDGSVYRGILQTVAARREESTASEGRVITVNRAGGVSAGEDVATNSVNLNSMALGGPFSPVLLQYFRVSGTNRSLRLPVVFSGNLIPQFSDATAAKPSTNTRQVWSMSTPSTAGPTVSSVLYFQLQGQVSVGGSNKIDIKALPAKH